MKNKQASVDTSVLGDLVDKIHDLFDRGEEVDVDVLALEFPQYKDRLTQMLPMLKELHTLDWSPSNGNSVGDHIGSAEQKTLGDFQVLNEIGRGGMGVVYEAKQITIDRKVALKILPFAALVDQRALQRFKNEVTAIATLDHPHIVSVYSVGEERGIHYFAMQLVKGQSLAEVIRELRFRAENEKAISGNLIRGSVPGNANNMDEEENEAADSPVSDVKTASDTVAQGKSKTNVSRIGDQSYYRKASQIVIQAADALQHAHENGIVHRDVKPGNLLLDSQGNLFVTDFGLARIETNTAMTLTGDALGTLRYMSPEQVLGYREMIDNRTDVYSLGATLYELLTLQPIWPAETKTDLIRKISFEEPINPRKINPAIPEELETIILKAISKNPTDRYRSAKDLRDDLQAHIDHMPIKARRPTLAKRVSKWTRRNPVVMWSSLAILLITVIAMGISFLMIAQERRDKDDALKMAQQNEQRAQKNFLQARTTVDEFLTNVSEDVLLDAPSMHGLRKKLLTLALNYYQSFVDEQGDNPDLQEEVAKSFRRIGSIHDQLGEKQKSIVAHQQALKIRSSLIKTNPGQVSYLIAQSETWVDLAIVNQFIGNISEAERLYVLATAQLDRLTLKDSNTSELMEASANVKHAFASFCQEFNRLEQAETHIKDAIKIRSKLTTKHPEFSDYQSNLADSINTLGRIYLKRNQFQESLEQHRLSIGIYNNLVEQNPTDLQYKYLLSYGLYNLFQNQYRSGSFNYSRGKHVEVDEQLAREVIETINTAINITNSLVEQNPRVTKYRALLVVQDLSFSIMSQKLGSFDLAESAAVDAISNARKLIEQEPTVPMYRNYLASGLNKLGSIKFDTGRLKEASSDLSDAAGILRKLIEEHPTNPYFLDSLFSTYSYLQKVQAYMGNFDAAVNFAAQSWAMAKQQAIDFPDMPEYQGFCAVCTANYCFRLITVNRCAEALGHADNGIVKFEKAYLTAPSRHRLIMCRLVMYKFILQRYLGLFESKETFSDLKDLTTEEIKAALFASYLLDYSVSNWDQAYLTCEEKLRAKEQLNVINCSSTDCWYYALCLARIGKKEQAIEYYDALVADLIEKNNRIDFFNALRAEAAMLLEIDDSDIPASAWEHCGRQMYSDGRLADARAALENCIACHGEDSPNTKNGDHWWFLTLVLARSGETELAMQYYDLLVDELERIEPADQRELIKYQKQAANLLELSHNLKTP